MAEYKNGFDYRGSMPVERQDSAPDVQTGRAVFVDEDLYEKDAGYKAKVDKCVEEGFHRISGDGSEGGGGGSQPLLVGFSAPGTLNKTWQEIFDAYPNAVMYNEDDDFVSKAGSITRVEYMVDQYKVYVLKNNIETIFNTNSADGYPVVHGS